MEDIIIHGCDIGVGEMCTHIVGLLDGVFEYSLCLSGSYLHAYQKWAEREHRSLTNKYG